MHDETQPAKPSWPAKLIRRSVRILLDLLALVFLICAVGVIYQTASEAQDRSNYPPPGQLVDVGGYRMHIFCMGDGRPTVILDAMADGMSVNWVRVQTELSKYTRVCAYDRAGLGWSEAGLEPRDALQGAQELHSLLTNAGISGPYVLVGHSYGAHVVRVYTSRYPEQVVGMALVDPGILYRDPRFPPEYGAAAEDDRRFLAMAPWLARLGLFRLSGQGNVLTQELPPEQSAEYAASYNSVRFWQTLSDQVRYLPDTTLQVQSASDLGDLPLVVLSASQPDDEIRQVWIDVNERLAWLSSRGVHHVIEGATHAGIVQNETYASETSAAILEIVQAAR